MRFISSWLDPMDGSAVINWIGTPKQKIAFLGNKVVNFRGSFLFQNWITFSLAVFSLITDR